LNAAVDARLLAELTSAAAQRSRRPQPSRRVGEITRWVADNRARRVPNFVIEATGLDTKKKILATFGANAAFEKGKPIPPTKVASKPGELTHKGEVKAKPPVIRKTAAATK
jgi:hypothetical protein